MGSNWSGLQLLITSWNPGNSEGTQHVLGPQEMPSDWEFMWRTTQLHRSPVVVTDPQRRISYEIRRAMQLAELLEEIARGGALLKVVWVSVAALQATAVPRITRIGRIQDWDYNPDRPDDIAASISFAWVGRGLDQPKVASVSNDNLNAANQRAINACNAAAEAIGADIIRNSLANRTGIAATTFTLGQLEAIADGPRQLVDSFARAAISVSNRLEDIGDLILKVKETPAALMGRLVDVANNGVAIANQFVDQLTREGPETQSTRTKVAILNRNASYFSGAQTQAEFMSETLERLAEAARQRRSALISNAGVSRGQDRARVSDNVAVHFPRRGETLTTISSLYYGTPDLSDEIAVANNLPAYTIVPPGIPLFIPTRRSLESNNRNRV